jgi:hypothetical protein
VGEQVARLANDCRVAVERGVSFARRFRGSIVLGRYIGNGEPLCFAVDAIKRLVTGIGKFQKTDQRALELVRLRTSEMETRGKARKM